MTSQYKLTKKTYTQNDLRRLMQERKSKSRQQRNSDQQKIDSPLVKYNDLGQFTCALCKSVVKSESVWKVHINTKTHKANLEFAKELKEKLESQSANQLKRVSTVSIGSNSAGCNIEKRIKLEQNVSNQAIPSDFFDRQTSPAEKPYEIKHEKSGLISKNMLKAQRIGVDCFLNKSSDEILPEGFFDDPVKDAKIRNLEYKDPKDKEWERFQREIKEEATISNAIIAGELDETIAERQMKEIDEQMERWSRVLELEKKKEFVSTKLCDRNAKTREGYAESGSIKSDGEDAGSGGESVNEFADWRSKKFHR